MKHELEQYYPGDELWAAFVAATPRAIDDFAGAHDLVSALGGSQDLARVLYAIIGDTVPTWVTTRKDMLDAKSPMECAAGDDALLRRLRTMLMRMGG